jgi:hypothetical protein
MPDFDYPRTATYRLGDALSDAEERVQTLQCRIDSLSDREDPPEGDLDEKRSERASWEQHKSALQWAVHGDDRDDGFDGWGEDAEVRLSSLTANDRGRALDTAQRTTVGDLGSRQARTWLIAVGIEAAPWISDDATLRERAAVTGSLPPALRDWLDEQLEDLNALGN